MLVLCTKHGTPSTILNDILESLMENNVEGKRSKCTSKSRGRDVLRKKRVAIGSLKVKYF